MLTRFDRATLRSPVRLGDGSVRVEAITSRVGVPLRYGDRVEVATVEALSDPEYLEALRGLGVVRERDHGDRIRADQRLRVGTTTAARFDPDEQAVVQEWVIDDPETAEAVLSGRLSECSECYDVRPESERRREDGVVEQLKRIPNHTAIVRAGRAAGTTIRRDKADTMDEEQIKELMAPFIARIAALEAKLEERADMEDGDDKEEAPTRSDSASAILAMGKRAAEHGIDIPDGLKTGADIARHIATALGADDTRCDSADYCEAWIAASRPAATKAQGQQNTGWTRSDSDTPTAHPF